MDVCGPITPATCGGNRYFLKIIDGHSKYRFIFPMSNKSQSFDFFLIFLHKAENYTGQTLKSVVSDNGGEFVNNRFKELFNSRGIVHHTTSPYTPQQNPFAERGNRTTVEKARAMLLTSGLPLEWWGEAVTTAVYLENRSPDSSILMKAPLELWTGSPPDLSSIHPFGCQVILYKEKHRRPSKLSPTGIEAILLGFEEGHWSYKLWVPKTKTIWNSHHVRFFPREFPFLTNDISEQHRRSVDLWCIPDSPVITNTADPPNVQSDPSSVPVPVESTNSDNSSSDSQSAADVFQTLVPGDNCSLVDGEYDPPLEGNESDIPPLPVASQPPVKGYAYVPHYDTAPQNISSEIDPSNIIEGLRRHQAMAIIGEPASMKDPKTFAQAMRRLDSHDWLMAVEVKLDNIRCHEVWVVSPMKTGTRQLDTVWVFKRKYNADGKLQKFKARLCIRGFRQVEGINYGETFAPTGRLATL
jgi:transposase InsO family protein